MSMVTNGPGCSGYIFWLAVWFSEGFWRGGGDPCFHLLGTSAPRSFFYIVACLVPFTLLSSTFYRFVFHSFNRFPFLFLRLSVIGVGRCVSSLRTGAPLTSGRPRLEPSCGSAPLQPFLPPPLLRSARGRAEGRGSGRGRRSDTIGPANGNWKRGSWQHRSSSSSSKSNHRRRNRGRRAVIAQQQL